MNRRRGVLRAFEVSAALIAIELVLLLSGRSSVPLPTGISVTVIAIPAILAGIISGPVVGALVGGVLGLASYGLATTPLFHDPAIAFVPRLLIGPVAALTYAAIRRVGLAAALAVAAALGAITNTGLILILAAVLTSRVGAPYVSPAVAWDVARTSLGYEVAVAVIIVTALGLGWDLIARRR